MGRGRRRSPDSHRAILDATRSLLTEVGYFRLTVEGVAARARVGKTTVYRWWPSKGALVVEAISGELSPAPQPTGDVRVDLRAAMWAMLDKLSGPFAETVLALAGELLRNDSGDSEPLAVFTAFRSAMERIMEDAAGRGDLPAGIDIPFLLDVCTGTLLLTVLSPRSAEGAVEKLVDLVVESEPPRRAVPRGD